MTTSDKNRKKVIFNPQGCNFSVNTNNLVTCEMIESIFDKFKIDAIDRMNQVINEIKFYVGGNQWHFGEAGILRETNYEFDFKTKTLYIFLSRIFENAFRRWKKSDYGALKRFIWESFFHEFIMALISINRINLDLLDVAVEIDLQDYSEFVQQFREDLLNSENKTIPNINFISINTELWKDELPSSLGFLEVLYHRRMDELKDDLSKNRLTFYEMHKFFNELRKIKLNYNYEYNLAELINYCLYNDHFEAYFKFNSSQKIKNKYYRKAKRLILKFFKKHDIQLVEYFDSSNRRHFFISHEVFERVKSVCLQVCLQNIKIELLEKYKEFKEFYSKCPICERENINQLICEKLYFSKSHAHFKESLLEAMHHVDSYDELNTESEYFGIPCDDCFYLTRSVNGEYSDLDQIIKFINTYNICPVCKNKNHSEYLISFYYDTSKKQLKQFLLNTMGSSFIKNIKINTGIPCCSCYREFFGELPEFINYSH
ncbi:MAG: hypothetical protein GF317_22330 [Candidatus Lokiarchaeota archaeon]|nr:hypothetical protein [Candidatus Lokiarchaeota archaeon]MBD3202198.1 hypothetical protein [Candidatus Lokiarchaeota archaeon]